MLKVIVLADASVAKELTHKLHEQNCKIVAVLTPEEYDAHIQDKYKADAIITNNAILNGILKTKSKDNLVPRQQVKAITHQGIRLVPVANVYYFQAEHKYVTAYHAQGQLLIEDSLMSLEEEFALSFIRIHRKTLVAKNKIENLVKGDDAQYYIKLQDRSEKLLVSRRQLPQVRKVIKWL